MLNEFNYTPYIHHKRIFSNLKKKSFYNFYLNFLQCMQQSSHAAMHISITYILPIFHPSFFFSLIHSLNNLIHEENSDFSNQQSASMLCKNQELPCRKSKLKDANKRFYKTFALFFSLSFHLDKLNYRALDQQL